jgi:hypothetical protein
VWGPNGSGDLSARSRVAIGAERRALSIRGATYLLPNVTSTGGWLRKIRNKSLILLVVAGGLEPPTLGL